MKGKAILLSSDSYAALHLIMTRFWLEFRGRGGQGANKMISINSLNL